MPSSTQNLPSKKHVNTAPVALGKALKDLVKPAKLNPAKDNSLERLLASCCDCV